MENLRQAIESDLHDSLEGEFKINVVLISPDAEEQNYSLLDPGERLGGRVQYFSVQESPTTGAPIVVDQPIVCLRIASLIRVPQPGERWIIKMPVSPRVGATISSWSFNVDKSSMHGTDIGFIKFYPQRMEQSDDEV
jgi:hypothetical protein